MEAQLDICQQTQDYTCRSTTHTFTKRIESACAVILLMITAPLIVLCAIILAIAFNATPLIAHRRIGKDGVMFWMLKLRTMDVIQARDRRGSCFIDRIVAEADGGLKTRGDVRVKSRFAAFCRRYSLDELPQLWHVIIGQMSLVGPRPLTRAELTRFYREADQEVVSALPGLTGLWQISGRSTLTMQQRVSMDIELVRTLTNKRYFEILARTLLVVVSGRGAW